MTDTTHLGLPFIADSQAQKHVTHIEALRILDAVIQIAVEDMTQTVPPASPVEGQRHVVASGATDAWAGHDDTIATWQDGAWVFLVPKTGWRLWSGADASIFIFDGGVWQPLAPPPNDVSLLGVNTTASTPNLLSVKSNAALLAAIATADGGSGDARLQISKEAAGNTASVFFSDDYSGRAARAGAEQRERKAGQARIGLDSVEDQFGSRAERRGVEPQFLVNAILHRFL